MSEKKIWEQNEVASGLVVAASAHSMLLHTNGTVECIKGTLLQDRGSAEKYDKGQTKIESQKNVAAIAANYLTSFALLENGTVVYEGEQFSGIEKIKNQKNVKAIACGTSHVVALKNDGTVFACGNNDNGACNVLGWKNIKKIVCGVSTTIGLREDGTVVACGNNRVGQCNVESWTDIVNLHADGNGTVGVKKDGTLVYTGEIEDKMAADMDQWTDIVSVAGDLFSNIIALKSDGTAVCSDLYYDWSAVKAWKNLVAVFCDNSVYLGLKSDGQLLSVEASSHTVMDTTKGYRSKRLFKNIDNIAQEREEAAAKYQKELDEKRQQEETAERIRQENIQKRKKKKTIVWTVCILLALAIIGGAIYYFTTALPAKNYEQACQLVTQGNTEEAWRMFNKLGDYRDSVERAKLYQWNHLEVGDTLYFGQYEQDNNTENGKEDIRWRVLDMENGKVLVISEKILDAVEFSNGSVIRDADGNFVTKKLSSDWEESTLRTWLNESFYTQAFTAEEQAKILNGEDGDKVTLLNLEQGNEYFDGELDGAAKRTAYAKAQGAERAWWWLQDGGVDWDGSGYEDFGYKTLFAVKKDIGPNSKYGVRPAMWISDEKIGQPEDKTDDSENLITVKVTSASVNLRKGPGTDYSVIGSVKKGNTVNILETTEAGGNIWGRTENGGWLCLKYTDYEP